MKNLFEKLFVTLGLVIFLITSPAFAAQKPQQVDCEVKDGSIIVADVYYPSVKKKKYSTILLLHSLGYNSSRWADFASNLADAGYAVVAVDLRGHGKSVYTSKLNRQSWSNYKKEVFKKYPDDVMRTLAAVKANHPFISFEDWGIVGADVGGSTAVLVAEKAKSKPKTIVLISPHQSHKGLFIPLAIAEMGNIPILTISSTGDKTCLAEQKSLQKYAQADYVIKNYDVNTTGMLMVTSNPNIAAFIKNWLESKVVQYQ